MTSNSLTENEEQDIPSHILKTILDCMPQLFFRPKYGWFPVHLKGPMIPDPSGQLAELIVYITSTRVDLYSHQSQVLHHNPLRARHASSAWVEGSLVAVGPLPLPSVSFKE